MGIHRIIHIPRLCPAIQAFGLQRIQRPAIEQPLGQVRVGNEGPSKGDQVRQPGLYQPCAALGGVAPGVDDPAAEGGAHGLAKCVGEVGGVVPIGFGNGHIGDARRFQHFDRFDIGKVRVFFHQADVDPVLVGATEQRRKAHAQALRPHHLAHRFDNLAQQAQAIVQRAAVLILTEVGMGRDELVNEVAVGRVNFHAVEPGVQGIARSLGVVPDQLFDFQRGQGTRDGWLHQFPPTRPGFNEGFGLQRRQRRRAHRGSTVRLQRVMGHPPHVP